MSIFLCLTEQRNIILRPLIAILQDDASKANRIIDKLQLAIVDTGTAELIDTDVYKRQVMVDVNTFGTCDACEDDCLAAAVRKAYDPVSYTHLLPSGPMSGITPVMREISHSVTRRRAATTGIGRDSGVSLQA